MTAEKARKIKFAAEFQFVRDLADVPLSSGKKVRRPARKKTVEEQLRTLPRVRREFLMNVSRFIRITSAICAMSIPMYVFRCRKVNSGS